MSLKLGTTDIAGIATKTKYNAHTLLDFKWSDHILNDISWLRADTFSWQDGSVYVSVYNYLVNSIQGATQTTDQGVTFYECENGLRIALANQENNVLSAYNNDGVAWYYILDTANTRFKLPRTKYNAYMSQVFVKGNGMTLGLTDGDKNYGIKYNSNTYERLAITYDGYGKNVGTINSNGGQSPANIVLGITTDASKSGLVADLKTDDNMFLYFYVGEYSQTAIEQTAGLNAELFNSKQDVLYAYN